MFKGSVTNFYTKMPMANVRVSDGKNIVFTNDEGKFSLPGWERANVINVNLLTNSHDDWYFNIDTHEGDFDFVVKPAQVGESFSFLHTSDTEIAGSRHNDWIDFARACVKEQKPAFFINTGDLACPDGVARHHLVMNSENMSCPVRYAIGNHDFCPGKYGEKLYETCYGPTYYSFDAGNIHFIVLSIGIGDKPSMYPKKDRLEWLAKDISLCGDKDIIILTHSFYRHKDAYGHNLEDYREYVGLERIKAVIYGHDHYDYTFECEGFVGICTSQANMGGIDSSPASIRRIDVDECANISSTLFRNTNPNTEKESESVWQTQLSGSVEYSNPVCVDGAVYVCTNDDGYPKECGIYKLDEKDGSVLGYIKTGAIKGDCKICDKKLYALDTEAHLYCVDTDTFEVLWSKKCDLSRTIYTKHGVVRLDGSIEVLEPTCVSDRDYTRLGVMIAENLIITGSKAHLTAFDKDTGDVVWSTTLGAAESSGRVVYDQKRKQLLVSANWNGLFALSIETGKVLWANKERPICWHSFSTPHLCGDVIYKRGGSTIGMIDANTGEVIKTVNTGVLLDVSGDCTMVGDELFVPTGEKGVLVFDKDTLEVKRTLSANLTMIYTAPYSMGNIQTVHTTPEVSGDNVIFASTDGYIHIYETKTDKKIKSINVKNPILAQPIIKDGYIITADFSGKVKKFKL